MLNRLAQFVFTLTVAVVIADLSHAELVLKVDTYTTDVLKFSISGTFETDTIGDSEGYLALKNDWTNNFGIHTELFSSMPTIASNTILIGGIAPSTTLQNSNESWADNLYFVNPLGSEVPILAGTIVSGSVTLAGIGAFDPSINSKLELVSGFVRPAGMEDWARFEASITGVPEPTSFLMFGVGMATITFRRRSNVRVV
ncbi:MAG: PEP-CTERM sorting domain-containing protein [Mariniblastus sp.]